MAEKLQITSHTDRQTDKLLVWTVNSYAGTLDIIHLDEVIAAIL